MNGKGKLNWPDGRSYEGDFIDDNKEGEGHFIWPDTKDPTKFRSYSGAWADGK